ncbi:TIGR03435 family protein [Occallatibacter savannae]|uniref:TIGR03435 family protein n=1 Tax=Occallatibacter savannae TaxID=1002691 RepID=UPI000D68CD48|nr:TIGR03435 family protein [Occallatibacter savannae]
MASMLMRLLRPAFASSLWIVAAGICHTVVLASQTPSQRLTFEVASIRPAALDTPGGEGSTRSQIQPTPDGLTLRNIDVDAMIEWAYGLQHYQLANPGLLHNHRYDVRARAAGSASEADVRLMLQSLLASRFGLRLHHQQKLTPVYELVVDKGGPKLSPDKSDKLPASYPRETFPRVVNGSFVFSNTSMSEFAQQLTEIRGIDLPVIDRTGIRGVYNITLKSAAAAVRDPNGPSLLTLIREQLGLRLASAKDPIDVVVVDHVEEPTAN